MQLRDLLQFGGSALWHYKTRSFLTALGIAVGIAAVVLLTSIGEGIHRFVLAEFTQFGTNLIAINPGRVTTQGTPLGVLGSVRPLSLDDATALGRLPHVDSVLPAVQGNGEVESGNRRRRTTIYGVGPEMPEIFRIKVALGQFLPADELAAPRAYAVLGRKVRDELFGVANPLGQKIRISGDRYVVIGVMEPKGQILGVDLDDSVYIPVAKALELFNRDGLMEIDVLYGEGASVQTVVAGIERILEARHGEKDFTITTQQQMLDVLGSVLNVLTIAVGALGGISLVVGGVGILTIMTIAVAERTEEIGLLRAVGAGQPQILVLFLGEAAALAAVGGLAGLLFGVGGAHLLHILVPALPVHTSMAYVILAEAAAVAIGLLAGVLPARRAAGLNPVEALRTE